MIILSKKLKYLFEKGSYPFYPHPKNGDKIRADKLCYVTFKGDTLKGLSEDDWDLIHLDGSYENCALDNLELVIFNDKEDSIKLKEEIKNLKKELAAKDEFIKKITFESKIKDGKVTNINKQVIYEQNRVKELNKEIKKMEKEIRRLLDITSKIHK